jgi:hypothetical protein
MDEQLPDMSSASTSIVRVICAGVIIGLAASSGYGQSPTLGDVAKKEAERRKAQPPAGKVYTNKDLPASAQKPAPPAAAPETPQAVDPVAAAAAEQRPEEPKPEGPQKDEAWWKTRITQAREELRRNQMFAEALQSRINALTREYANPISGPRRRVVGEQRVEAVNELSRVAQEIERGKAQVAEIEEEARKAGVPPGWLR